MARLHGWDHRRVHRFTPETFREDLLKSKDVLEQATGHPVVGFRAPTFSIVRETGWAVDVLAECAVAASKGRASGPAQASEQAEGS